MYTNRISPYANPNETKYKKDNQTGKLKRMDIFKDNKSKRQLKHPIASMLVFMFEASSSWMILDPPLIISLPI